MARLVLYVRPDVLEALKMWAGPRSTVSAVGSFLLEEALSKRPTVPKIPHPLGPGESERDNGNWALASDAPVLQATRKPEPDHGSRSESQGPVSRYFDR